MYVYVYINQKSKFSSRANKNYENKCELHEISRRIDWEGPQGPKIGFKINSQLMTTILYIGFFQKLFIGFEKQFNKNPGARGKTIGPQIRKNLDLGGRAGANFSSGEQYVFFPGPGILYYNILKNIGTL